MSHPKCFAMKPEKMPGNKALLLKANGLSPREADQACDM